jgi:prolyl-tRNA synthetase
MGGSQSQEFMVYTDAGEDLIASCPACGYAANLEKATSKLEAVVEMEPTGDGSVARIHTPGMGAIADIAAFLKMSAANDIKCVAYMTEVRFPDGKSSWQPLVAFLRGDHSVNEAKLMGLVGAVDLRPMVAEELEKYFKGPAGYLGPIGLNVIPPVEQPVAGRIYGQMPSVAALTFGHGTEDQVYVVLDVSLRYRKNMVAGANELDYHVRNVTPGRDFTWTVAANIRSVNEGESCPQDNCAGKLVVGKAVEIGHIFKLGYKYSESMGARVLDPNGKEVIPIMGSYGIGIERILTAAIEQSNDKNGFWLPASIAPFTVVVTVTNVGDPLLKKTGEELAAELESAGLDVLLDDRDERAGVKFKDADLVGIPYRINVGKKAIEGKVELVTRAASTSVDVAIGDVLALLKERVQEDALLTEVTA